MDSIRPTRTPGMLRLLADELESDYNRRDYVLIQINDNGNYSSVFGASNDRFRLAGAMEHLKLEILKNE